MTEAAIELTSDVVAIESVRAFVKDRTADLALGDGVLYQLQLALVEAVTNIIVHAYRGERGHPIWLEMSQDHEGLTFEVRDKGTFFDFSKLPDPDLKRHVAERKTGGLGVYMMRKLMDDLKISHEGDWNVLRMRKRLIS